MNKTMLVGIVALIAGVASFFGVEIDEAGQKTLIEALSGLAAGVGVIMTAIGSYKSGISKAASKEAPTKAESVEK